MRVDESFICFQPKHVTVIGEACIQKCLLLLLALHIVTIWLQRQNCEVSNSPYPYPTGEGPRGEGRERPVGPVRAGDAAARQEAPTRDQDQATHTQPQVERDILLRR